jgi:hypothetical protein
MQSKKSLYLLPLFAVFLVLSGCAAVPKPQGTRFSHGVISKEPFTYSIHALEKRNDQALEFIVLKTALGQALEKRGNKNASQGPELVFLLGYATEIGVDAPYDNFIVLLGYEAASAKPVYQARVKVESSGKRIEQVGARVLDALMTDLSKPGANIEPLRLSLGDL